ncbi:MAG: hypothetical protein JO107_15390, partial [Hyphomicrobiales bacterium]|nr:hypothetical protein [Hyphomicrobiales bacterium]
MTRAGAANEESRPSSDGAEGFAPIPRAARAIARAIKRWLPFIPSVAASILLIALLALTVEHLYAERQRALSAAARELDLTATALAHNLDQALAASPTSAPLDVMRQVLAASPDLQPGRMLLADANGLVIAGLPERAGADGGVMLSAVFGAGDPLTILAEKAGALRLSTN